MAVFYKWLKGCTEGASLTSKQWSYVTWGDNATKIEGEGESQHEVLDTLTTDVMPKLKASAGRKSTLYCSNEEAEEAGAENKNAEDLGYFLTSKMPTPWFDSNFVEKKKFYFVNGADATITEDSDLGVIANTSFQQGSNFEVQSNTDFLINANNIKLQGSLILDGDGNVEISKNLIVKDTDSTPLALFSTCQIGGESSNFNTINKDLSDDSDKYIFNVDGNSYFDGMIKANQQCEAQWFNATSDVRAKENIKPANYSALELIEKLPIYTYNYKNNNETVTGILAQDLLIAQPSNLELVSNINASGENNDYMSIKNDKLMFVLMKAIQEQQEQIKQLKSKIENLKKTI